MFRADTRGLRQFARNLRLSGPAAWLGVRTTLPRAVQPVAADARARASFSSRIPASIRVHVSGSGGTVEVIAGGDQAPDAAPLEHHGEGGTFQHPVFGQMDVLVDQEAHPFLGPAMEAHQDQVVEEVADGVYEAIVRTLNL